MATSQQPPSIPLVLVGLTRAMALSTSTILAGTPYYITAALDQTESPPAYQLSSQNLGVVLHTLHPRPRAVITGTAVSKDVMEAVEKAWEEYKGGVLEKEGLGGVWVALSRWYDGEGKPPPPGFAEEMLRQLDETFA